MGCGERGKGEPTTKGGILPSATLRETPQWETLQAQHNWELAEARSVLDEEDARQALSATLMQVARAERARAARRGEQLEWEGAGMAQGAARPAPRVGHVRTRDKARASDAALFSPPLPPQRPAYHPPSAHQQREVGGHAGQEREDEGARELRWVPTSPVTKGQFTKRVKDRERKRLRDKARRGEA